MKVFIYDSSSGDCRLSSSSVCVPSGYTILWLNSYSAFLDALEYCVSRGCVDVARQVAGYMSRCNLTKI